MKKITDRKFTKTICRMAITALIFINLSCISDTAKELEIIQTEFGIEMVAIPGGWFEMGDKLNSEGDALLHRIWVDAFCMDRYEVTQEVYRNLQISDTSRFDGGGLPVEQKTWIDAAGSWEAGVGPSLFIQNKEVMPIIT